MTIYTIITISLLIYLGKIETFIEGLRCDGDKKALADGIVNVIIQSWSGLMYDTVANLEMGFKNVPYDKQYSLRILKKRITVNDVIRALHNADDYIMQNTDMGGVSFAEKSPEDILRLYRTIEPALYLIKIEFTDDEIIDAYKAYIK